MLPSASLASCSSIGRPASHLGGEVGRDHQSPDVVGGVGGCDVESLEIELFALELVEEGLAQEAVVLVDHLQGDSRLGRTAAATAQHDAEEEHEHHRHEEHEEDVLPGRQEEPRVVQRQVQGSPHELISR